MPLRIDGKRERVCADNDPAQYAAAHGIQGGDSSHFGHEQMAGLCIHRHHTGTTKELKAAHERAGACIENRKRGTIPGSDKEAMVQFINKYVGRESPALMGIEHHPTSSIQHARAGGTSHKHMSDLCIDRYRLRRRAD